MVEVEVKNCRGRAKRLGQSYKIIHFTYCIRDEFLTAVKLLCYIILKVPTPLTVKSTEKFVVNRLTRLLALDQSEIRSDQRASRQKSTEFRNFQRTVW